MCIIVSTSHICHHKTFSVATRPCQYFLDNYARQRWRSQHECPYKRFTHKRDGKVCQGCTTEFAHPYRGPGGEEGGGEIERIRTERMSRRESMRRESMRRESLRRESVRGERARSPERGGTFKRALGRLVVIGAVCLVLTVRRNSEYF
ncbi:hypothetical protein VE01_02484 [Pseudogymnoascus verrucosus]|uniref:Uncharacterized protein n=1 Tax=Pseudogymnoascus verrucosus TaxID=342668 RepID=A0A1B8GSW0_9PEZI|nr:uncharacterized protein VE01_02484 [Pseudogymnoascus verrucosus]OBT98890.1 hypothetical protein VE01_02484 [Pseudogymnoascus verrucosus]